MGTEAWLTAGVLLAMLAGLASGRVAPDLALGGALLLLLISGIIGPAEAIAGFANPGVATIALLYIVAAGMKETGAVRGMAARLIGQPRSTLDAQARLIGPIAALSAFTNNTPLVAAMLPVLDSTARRAGIAASRLFMPLSFAAILGGMCTLIGTSTNLVVHGLIKQHNALPDATPIREFGMFTVAWVGVPVMAVGLAYILVFGRALLPTREDPMSAEASAKRYMTEVRVERGSPVAGKNVEEAGLRHLPGLFLSRIDRGDRSITAVGPGERVREGDVLVLVGDLDSVVDLQSTRGLTPVTAESDEANGGNRHSMKLIEAVVSPSSPLVGQTVRDAAIRSRYNAVVIAAHRFGHKLSGKIGDIVIHPGDTLLLEAGPDFASRYRGSSEFHLVSELEGAAAPRHARAPIAIGIMVALVAALSAGLLQPMVGAMAAAGLMIITRCCTGPQARASIDWSVLIVVASAFGIGNAMQASGLAPFLADRLIDVAGSGGPVAILAAIYVLTVVFTMLMSNTAAAVLMFPVAIDAASVAGIDALPVAVLVAIAASADFSTPLGYQTNLMVLGPGGYRWIDFTRFGTPLTLLAGAVAIGATMVAFGPLGTS